VDWVSDASIEMIVPNTAKHSINARMILFAFEIIFAFSPFFSPEEARCADQHFLPSQIPSL
jgi:hypothetical protein